MWIVRIALKRPYTFVVLALLILMVGPLTIARTPTDIFPNIDIPVVTVVWNYAGLSADEMSTRIEGLPQGRRPDARFICGRACARATAWYRLRLASLS